MKVRFDYAFMLSSIGSWEIFQLMIENMIFVIRSCRNERGERFRRWRGAVTRLTSARTWCKHYLYLDLVQTLSLSGPGANIIIIKTWCKHYHDIVTKLDTCQVLGSLCGDAILTLTNDTICQTRASLQCNLRLSRHGAFHCHTHM